MYPSALQTAQKVRGGLLLYDVLECGIIPGGYAMCVFVGGGGGSVAMECVLIYFPSPQINPFFPGATGDAIRAVAREGSHLSKHQARAQLG